MVHDEHWPSWLLGYENQNQKNSLSIHSLILLSGAVGKKTFQSSLRQLAPLVVTIIGVGLVLLALNIFQYFKVKRDLSNALVQSIAVSDLREVRSFFRNFELKLKIVREWGRNGILDIDNLTDLNKKFMPFLQEQSNISGLLLADTKGREYYLMNRNGKLVTRSIALQQSRDDAVFQEWSSPEKSLRSWREGISGYDARTRPWFRTDQKEGEVFFTPIYQFYHSGQKGITASASWREAGDATHLFVAGLDINVDNIRALLASMNDSKKTTLFLVNGGNGAMLSDTAEGGDPGSGQLSNEVLKLLVKSWRETGKPSATPAELNIGKIRYLASLQPVNADNPTVWVGVAASEKALLSTINSSLYGFELTDFIVVFAGGVVFLMILIRYRHLAHSSEQTLSPEARVTRAIAHGEGAKVEFKSSVRTNLTTGKTGKEIELAWLKAVVAFLNSQGGVLLLGVNDEGFFSGVEVDGFENDDKCLLHIKNCLHQHIGAEYSPFITVGVVEMELKKVVLIEVEPATAHAFLKIGKNEEFYIRSGPSSTKLAPSQIVSYVTQKQKAADLK